MSTTRGYAPLTYRQIGRAELGLVSGLEIEPEVRFLEPIPEIVAFVRRGIAHAMVGIEAAGELVGFYVVHPDQRDGACWWLGWLAIDRRRQGAGYGREAMAAIMARLRSLPGCRRVRLLVAAENAPALRLYERAGFRPVDIWAPTGELVMERAQTSGQPETPRVPGLVVTALTLILAMCLRLWRRGVPPSARMSGEFHGPPATQRALRLSGGSHAPRPAPAWLPARAR